MNRPFWAALWGLSCFHARPAEMTAEEHRAEARVHQEAARKERADYQAGATVRGPPGRTPFVDADTNLGTPYNPTAEHLGTADRELRQAADHLAAARVLEAFEAAACKGLNPAERSACPLLASWVSLVTPTRDGLLLTLKAGMDSKLIHERLQCHLAYAQAKGFEKPSCPLFVRGVSSNLAGEALEFKGDSPEVAKRLQIEARRVFAPETLPTPVGVNP